MYLKSLTLRGFKSFASATTLAFEPGVTAVVGPNGSGKSNVVDALAWVMGEQGAKTLRGGKMEDVIFAGTAGRPPLGRAEVSLTIDNTDGALPIDYAEVTITRTMFRAGGSEYAINGNAARLLDVQELLSDSGIGREMHVIVGQGQLDAILRASPEERRGFIEEAAGVLKHRKRKEKALRKLEAMGANLTRVSDLAGELRRQLTPLGRQAKVARRANVIQADLRDAGMRLLADDVVALQASFESDRASQAALLEQQGQVCDALAAAREEEARLEARWGEHGPALRAAQQTWQELASLRERMVGLASVAGDRARGLAGEAVEEPSGRDPDELLAESHRMRMREAELQAELAAQRERLAAAVAARTTAEAIAATADQEFRVALRAASDHREGVARLTGQVGAARSRLEARTAEVARLESAESAARQRAATAASRFAALEGDVAGLDAGEVNLDSQYEEAAASLSEIDDQIAHLLARGGELQQRRAAGLARESALAAMAVVGDGASELLDAGLPGICGPLASQIRVRPGLERAVAAALGPLAEALVAGDLATAGVALRRTSGSGRVALVVGESPSDLRVRWSPPPAATEYLWDVLSGPPAVMAGLSRALESVVLTPDGLDQALDVVGRHPSLLAVTPDGLLVGRGGAVGGTPGPAGSLELLADLDSTREELERLGHEEQRLRFELTGLQARRAELSGVAEAALAALHESDARMAALAEQLGTLNSAVRAANAEAERLAANLAAAEQARAADERTLSELTLRLDRATDVDTPAEPTPSARDEAAAAAADSRRAETEARLGVRTAEERIRAISGRAQQLERAASAERAARDRAVARRQRRAEARSLCLSVAKAAEVVVTSLEVALAVAAADRDAVESAATQADAGLRDARARVRQLAGELARLTDAVHRDELITASQQKQLEVLADRAMSEYGVSVETLVAEYGPDQLVPPSPVASGEEVDPAATPPEPRLYVRVEQERRFKEAQQGLAVLGKVNPLALEEFDALSERHRFLTEQLEDLKRSRKDLIELIRDVDRRVEEVFTAAYADTATQFKAVFSRLFPGGSGELVLTDPDSMLTTGVDVAAAPPGKKVRRLSLLSGGERSLTAVAFLVALFKARPSPFYVLDEVEAALDDTNLSRLLDVIEELRADSQLIVITHQKRTMEVADALYGISMRGDGVSAVISQRLREPSR